MFIISERKKAEGRHCCAYACKHEPVKKKGGLCHKHYARKRKELDPIYQRYNSFKSTSKSRGKDFDITLEEFKKFCKDTGYLIVKGRRGANATIDRVDNKKGYSLDNIQLLTQRQNSSKGTKECPF